MEELKAELKQLEEAHVKLKRRAIRNYCLSKNKVKLGDILTDHIGSIKVQKIGIYYNASDSQCVYDGIVLTKSLKPRKDSSLRSVFLNNIKQHTVS